MGRMATISIVFPSSDSASFNYEYAEKVHLPLVLDRWGQSGLEKAELFRGLANVDGSAPPFLAIGLLRFSSLSHLQTAMAGEHAAEIAADIAKFTNVKPLLQVNARMAA